MNLLVTLRDLLDDLERKSRVVNRPDYHRLPAEDQIALENERMIARSRIFALFNETEVEAARAALAEFDAAAKGGE